MIGCTEKTLIDAPLTTPVARPLYGASTPGLQIARLMALLVGLFLALAPAAAQTRILAFGDSLTASPGVTADDSLAAQLKRRLLADGYDIEVVSAGVSGDTTTTGLARLDYTLDSGPIDMAIVELGANDMLNGHDPKLTRANLDQIVTTMQARGVKVMLAAMVSSGNWGQAYKKDFDSIYPDLAEKHGVTMIPFFLEGVWGQPSMLIADGVHPNTAGITKIVKRLASPVEKQLAAMGVKKVSQNR